jgi:hypothetical protein
VRNDGTSVKWWTRGQPLTLPAGDAKRQRIGDESNELVNPKNLRTCIGFGISTLSKYRTRYAITFGLAAAVWRFRCRPKSGRRRFLMSVLHQCFGIPRAVSSVLMSSFLSW